MTFEENIFIVETLEVMKDWTDYAPDYFKEKHNLSKDLEDVSKAIAILLNEKVIDENQV